MSTNEERSTAWFEWASAVLAAAEARKRKREQLRDSNPLLGGRSVGRSVGTPDKNQTSCRRRADAKKG